MHFKKITLGLFFFSCLAQAKVQIGSGFNSATGGRLVPSLNLGIGGDSFTALISTTGVSNSSYYTSAYTLGGYWTRNAGEIASGPVTVGFGLGALYAERGFQDTGATLEKKTDYVLGPSFFSQWKFIGPVFICVEGIYGLLGPSNKNTDVLALNARDHVNFILGVQL